MDLVGQVHHGADVVRDHQHVAAVALQLLGRTHEVVGFLGGDAREVLRTGRSVGVTSVARDAHEAYTGNGRDLPTEVDARGAGRPAQTTLAGVDLEQDVE